MFINNKVGKPKTGGNFNQQNVRFFLGTRFRSKSGCLTCRKKKRKCDEVSPVCLYCESKGLECVYPGKELVKVKKETKKTDLEVLSNGIVGVSSENSRNKEPAFNSFNFNIDPIFNISPSMYPSSIPSLCLDEKGIHCLEYFHVKSAQGLSIAPDSFNYFKKLFYLLANTEKAFTYVIAAWGSIYTNNYNKDPQTTLYLRKGVEEFNRLFEHGQTLFDYYFKICFFLILTEFEVCRGDTNEWMKYFTMVSNLIQEYGGIAKLCKDFGYSHEIRFLISNHQYNDIMSSRAMKYGTVHLIEEYKLIFNNEEFIKQELSYGVDTLQACHQSALLLLGEIMNTKVRLEGEIKQLSVMTPEEYLEKQSQVFELQTSMINKITYEINTIEPHFMINKVSHQERDWYRLAFEMFRTCCEFYLRSYIERKPPIHYQVQQLVTKLNAYIDQLMHSKMSVVLCLPSLLCGISSITQADKDNIRVKIDCIDKYTPVKNMDKCWAMIQRTWEINPNGDKVVDWSDVSDEFGWYVNIC